MKLKYFINQLIEALKCPHSPRKAGPSEALGSTQYKEEGGPGIHT